MTIFQLSMLLSLAAIWGASFVFARIAVPALGAFVVADAQVLLVGLALLGYAAARRALPAFTKSWPLYMLLGLFNAAANSH